MKMRTMSALLAALLFTAFQVHAGIITDVVEINQRVGGLISDGAGIRPNIQRISWVHDLSDTFFTPGTLTSASLTIELSDDRQDIITQFERASIVVGILDYLDDTPIFKPDTNWFGALGIGSMFALNSSGQLSVEVSSMFGTDFVVGSSILEVSTISSFGSVAATEFLSDSSSLEASSVPEPGAVLLLGIGLVGLATLRRQSVLK